LSISQSLAKEQLKTVLPAKKVYPNLGGGGWGKKYLNLTKNVE